VINHVVLFKWKRKVSQATIDEIYRGLEGLKGVIPGLQSFSGGPYSSLEGLNRGYTHGFIMTFTDAAARDAYLLHSAHERMKAMIVPNLKRGIAFDWAA
jgi:Stress responsive A/B Barrel Domain